MSKKMLMIAGGAIALLAAGGGGYFYMTANPDTEAAPEPETLGMVTLEPFLANVQGSGGRRHARIAITLAVTPEERAAEVSADTLAMARLRDRVLTLITAKSAEELTSPEGKAALRKEIIAGAAPLVEPGSVKEALFAELVVQ